jgi:hypothetical protein
MSLSTSSAANPPGGVNGAGAAPFDKSGAVPGHGMVDAW